MNKILLFPYHPDMDLLIEYAFGLREVQVIGVCSYKEDAIVTDVLNKKLGSSGDFNHMLAECDQMLLLENYRNCNTEKYYEVMEKAMNAGKQVILMPQLEQELNLAPYKGQYKIIRNLPKINPSEPDRWKFFNREKYKIDTPVIAVFGMGKHCNKFENQLMLKAILDEEGYDAVWLSSNPLGALFGGYTMPDFLYDEKLSFGRKVFEFNEFLYHIEIAKKPEVFVIGVSEGISEFEMHEYHHFAEYPLVLGSAVSVDSAVLCTYYLNSPDIHGISEAAKHSREKFAFPVDVVSIGKTLFETVQGRDDMTYSFLSKNYTEKHFLPIESLPDFVTTMWNADRTKTALKNMLGRLQSNADAI